MKAAKINHTKGLEVAMGMTFVKLNKLRGVSCELAAVSKTAEYTPEMEQRRVAVKAQIEAAHAAMAVYRAEQGIDSRNNPIKKI